MSASGEEMVSIQYRDTQGLRMLQEEKVEVNLMLHTTYSPPQSRSVKTEGLIYQRCTVLNLKCVLNNSVFIKCADLFQWLLFVVSLFYPRFNAVIKCQHISKH